MKSKDVLYYIQGNVRYYLFYSIFAELIRTHIREQILFRINSMDIECFNKGECKLCGCKTTALQMCNKPCDKPCYPTMLSKKEWEYAKKLSVYVDSSDRIWEITEDKFILHVV